MAPQSTTSIPDPTAVEVAPGKTIARNGVVVVSSSAYLTEVPAGHGAVGMTKRPMFTYHDTRGPLCQGVIYTYAEGAFFERHGHDGDQPMDELFYVLFGSVTFTYDGSDGQPVVTTIQSDAESWGSGGIIFPAGVYHSAVANTRSLLIVQGIRFGDIALCDLEQRKGLNIPK